MAKLKLEVESLVGDGLHGFDQLGASVGNISKEVNAFKTDSKTAFGGAAKEVKVFDDAVKQGVKDTKSLDDGVKTVAKSANKLKELKNQIKEYNSEALRAKANGDQLGFEKNIAKAGELKDELKDLQSAVAALTGNVGENLAGALGRATSLGSQGFEAMLSAQALFGEENKDVQKQLLKLQAIQSLSRLAGEFADVGDRLSEIKSGLAPVINGYKGANASLINFAKTADFSFKGIASGTAGIFKSLAGGISNFVKSGVAGIKTLGATIAANPFGLILVVIAAVIGIMVALKDKVKPIAALFEFLGNIINFIGDSLEAVGEAIGIVDSKFEKQSKNIVANTQKQLDAITDRYDKEIQLAEAAGGKTGELEGKKTKALLDRVIQSIAILKAKKEMEGKLSEEELKQLEEFEKQKADFIFEGVLANVKEQKKQREEEDKLRKEAADKAKQAAEKAKQLQKDLFAALLDLRKKAAAAEAEMATGEDRLAKQKAISDEELKLLRNTIIEKGRLTNSNFKLTAEQEAQFQILQLSVNKKYADDIIALEVEKANRLAEQHKRAADNDVKFFELQARLRIAAVNGAQRPDGVSEELFEMQKQRNILIIQKQAAQEQLAEKQQALKAEAEVQTIAAQNELLQLYGKNDELSNIKRAQLEQNVQQIKDNLELETNVLNAETDAQITALGKQIEESTEKINNHGGLIDWQKILGLDDKQFGQLKQAMGQMREELQKASDAVFQLMNQQLEFEATRLETELNTIQQRSDARDAEISTLEGQLVEETRLGDQGLANNVSRVREELAAKEAARQADLAAQKRLVEEQKKLQDEKKRLAKIQFAVDTALQASNLVTAVSEVFVTYAAVPYVAAALAALMVGSFVVSKVAAYKAINNTPASGFKKGGYTGSGNENEEAGVVHKEEFVHTAKKTRKYRKLFEGIHNDDNSMIEAGLLDLLNGTGVSLSQEMPEALSAKKEVLRASEYNLHYSTATDNSGVEKRLEKQERLLGELVAQGNNYDKVLPDGRTLRKRGDITTIIKHG